MNAGAEAGGDERDDRGRPAVAARVERPREQQEDAVRAAARSPSEAIAAASRSTLWFWLSTVIARIAGTARATNAADTGTMSSAMLSSAHRTPAGERRVVVALRVERELGLDRGLHRVGEDRVRGEEQHERELVRDDATLDPVAEHDRGAEQDADPHVLEHGPARESHQAAEPLVARHEPRAAAGTRCGAARPRARRRTRARRSSRRGQHELLGEGQVEVRRCSRAAPRRSPARSRARRCWRSARSRGSRSCAWRRAPRSRRCPSRRTGPGG